MTMLWCSAIADNSLVNDSTIIMKETVPDNQPLSTMNLSVYVHAIKLWYIDLILFIFQQAERLQLKRVDEVDTDLNIPVPEPISLENGVTFYVCLYFRRDKIILSFPVTFKDFSGSVGRKKNFLTRKNVTSRSWLKLGIA